MSKPRQDIRVSPEFPNQNFMQISHVVPELWSNKQTNKQYTLIIVYVKSTRNNENGFMHFDYFRCSKSDRYNVNEIRPFDECKIWMSCLPGTSSLISTSLLVTTIMKVNPLILADVKSLLETKIGLDPLMRTKCGCIVSLQLRKMVYTLWLVWIMDVKSTWNIKNGFTPFDMLKIFIYMQLECVSIMSWLVHNANVNGVV